MPLKFIAGSSFKMHANTKLIYAFSEVLVGFKNNWMVKYSKKAVGLLKF